MILAYHVIFTTYGFWLPNDPRGSWSDFVRVWELYWWGDATKVTTRRSLARAPHDRKLRRVQKDSLRLDPVLFTGQQALSVAKGFIVAIRESGYEVYACSILPGHVHMVLGRHETSAEKRVGHLKARATQQLVDDGLHPFADLRDEKTGRFPSVWARRAWKVFLDSDEDVIRAIDYVEGNPQNDGKPRQTWSFVVPYFGRG
jgi:REP element-mobilizing transposase RayT